MHMRKVGTGMFMPIIMTVVAMPADDEMQQPGSKETHLKNQAQNRYRFPPSVFHEHHFRLAVIRNVYQSSASVMNIGPIQGVYIHLPDQSNPSPHLLNS